MRHAYLPGVAIMFQCEGEYPLQFFFLIFNLKSSAGCAATQNSSQTCGIVTTPRMQAPKQLPLSLRLSSDSSRKILLFSELVVIGVQAESLLASGASGPMSTAEYGLDMARRVPSTTVSTIQGIISAGGGDLGLRTSSMKL